MAKIRLLSYRDEVGLFSDGILEVFKRDEEKLLARPTDLVGLLGGIKDKLGYTPYWTMESAKSSVGVIASSEYSSRFHITAGRNSVLPSIRPVISINEIEKDKVIGDLSKDLIVSLGEYPQTIETNSEILEELEFLDSDNPYHVTGKKYHLKDSSEVYIEYVYDGKKYIKIDYNSIISAIYDQKESENFILSDGSKIEKNKTYWVRVEPVKWIVSLEKNILISLYGLLSGIHFWDNSIEYDFDKSAMSTFLNDKMSYDLFKIFGIKREKDITGYLSNNAFGISNLVIPEEMKIKELINAGISLFIHGDTGIGKSARVREIDDKCIIIYVCNETLDSLNGKSAYIPPLVKEKKIIEDGHEEIINEIVREGYMMDVKPSWLVRLEEVCNNDPENIHILFFDEITNAPPAVQRFVFNIILDREVNGKWKLPNNARIIAAGNEIDDSISAYEIAPPLYGRFAHLYLNDDLNKWLLWANSVNIHPAIIAFISCMGIDVLRSKYTGLTPNADPRRWEMASKILYSTSNINLLKGIIGEDLTNLFSSFYLQKLPTIDDIINGNYSENIFNCDTNMKYALAHTLSYVDDENFDVVHNFMIKIGKEACRVFESLYSRNNPKREEKILEKKMMGNGYGK